MKLCPKCQKQFSDDANFCPVDAARLVPFEGEAAAGLLVLVLALGGGRFGVRSHGRSFADERSFLAHVGAELQSPGNALTIRMIRGIRR